jgi:hypothetical protein
MTKQLNLVVITRVSQLLTQLGIGVNQAARRLEIDPRELRRMAKGTRETPHVVLLALERMAESISSKCPHVHRVNGVCQACGERVRP